MAHELRQPLSTIESIAYYLELALPHMDARVLEQLTRLRHLVEQSGWILNDALSLSRVNAERMEALDLDEMLSEFVLEQMQHDVHRPSFNLELSGVPVWMDYQQGRELVYGVCRLFRTLAKPGADIAIVTRVLATGRVLLRARTEGHSGDESSLPPGANLTLEWIEKIAAQSQATLFIRLSEPSRLELALEIPAAVPVPQQFVESVEGLPSFEEGAKPEQVAPSSL